MPKIGVRLLPGVGSCSYTKVLVVALAISHLCLAGGLIAAEPNSSPAKSVPARILIIRHAEKPAKGEASADLSAEGFKRAEALPRLFEATDSRSRPLPKPDFLFAAAQSEHSNRSVETVMPLAKKLGLTIDSTYPDRGFEKLAQEILSDSKYGGKTILICWHHGRIPQLAHALKAIDAPDAWKDSQFNRVWRIDYDADGKTSFRNLPQNLLEGDKIEKVESR